MYLFKKLSHYIDSLGSDTETYGREFDLRNYEYDNESTTNSYNSINNTYYTNYSCSNNYSTGGNTILKSIRFQNL